MKHILSIAFLFIAFGLASQTTLSTANGDFPVGASTDWEVPANVFSIVVTTAGGGGGNADGFGANVATGGFGAVVGAQFEVMPGDMLRIIVGARGSDGVMPSAGDAGGGGGTAIINLTQGNTVLQVAGGGGGAHGSANSGEDVDGDDALAPGGSLGGGAAAPQSPLGGGGGGSTSAGHLGTGGATGGGGGDPSGGMGGASTTNGGDGGFGYGAGGGASNGGAGGGGGSVGGQGGTGSGMIGRQGKGGGSFQDGSAMAVNFALAPTNEDGSVIITFEEQIPVPTMGQWGIAILILLLGAIGIIWIRNTRRSTIQLTK